MDDPSRILAQARQQLEALKQAGLSREAIMALLEEEPQQQHQHMTPATPVTPDGTSLSIPNHGSSYVDCVQPGAALQNLSYHDFNTSFKPPPQYRASVSTVSSSSSGDSCFSALSGLGTDQVVNAKTVREDGRLVEARGEQLASTIWEGGYLGIIVELTINVYSPKQMS
ncbi:hypothetical protein NUW58_g2909 [Xylaria curta]|uniref:Uncharacterized protein n=1 Tax=Xylaria curta TaxID=42375 RepID=A0ACC1PEC0_9PEZI|nr:hypothetical protein NUW58_g2909 [Xylaria curta]